MLTEPAVQGLVVRGLHAGYGGRPVLEGISLYLGMGEVVAVIGHNGSGKSTLLKTIYGVVPALSGEILIDGEPLPKTGPKFRLARGIGYVPQRNNVFRGLTVRENLLMGGVSVHRHEVVQIGIESVLTIFPELKKLLARRVETLSGGEMQMVALATGLVVSPRLILLDEPSLGLAAPLASRSLDLIATLAREHNISVMIVEQKVREVLRISERVYVLKHGRISFTGQSADLASESQLREIFL